MVATRKALTSAPHEIEGGECVLPWDGVYRTPILGFFPSPLACSCVLLNLYEIHISTSFCWRADLMHVM